jgi:hypothetical protein
MSGKERRTKGWNRQLNLWVFFSKLPTIVETYFHLHPFEHLRPCTFSEVIFIAISFIQHAFLEHSRLRGCGFRWCS